MTPEEDSPSPGRRSAVFVERATYRRRRLGDAARFLPVLGAVVFAVPLLWSGSAAEAPGGEAMKTSSAMIYIFTGWAVLIGMAFLFGLSARFWSLMDDQTSQKPPS